MMIKRWPTAAEFLQMVQHPSSVFVDERLKAVRFAIDPNTGGLPRPWTGNYAVVFKAEHRKTNEYMAVRIFTRNSPKRRDRYQAISEHLATNHPQSMVGFEYREREVLAPDGKRYPLVIMDWVEGQTLWDWVRQVCAAGERSRFERISQSWRAVVAELRANRIVHGDLCHDNILVTPEDRLTLVDYDGVAVPALFGLPNFECGQNPYQHPKRGERTLLGPHLDNFSALLIHVALRALSFQPNWWNQYVEGRATRGRKGLLFASDDIEAKGNSDLFQELLRSDDEVLRYLTTILLRSLDAELEQIPSLEEALGNRSAVIPPDFGVSVESSEAEVGEVPYIDVTPELVPNPSSEPQPPADLQHAAPVLPALDELNRLIRRADEIVLEELEEGIVRLAEAPSLANTQLPTERVTLAGERVDAIKRFRGALEDEYEKDIAEVWKALDDLRIRHWAEEEEKDRAETAVARARAWDAAERLAPKQLDREFDEELTGNWNEQVCSGWECLEDWEPIYEAAKTRLSLLSRLEEFVESKDQAGVAAIIDGDLWNDYEFPEAWMPVIALVQDALRSVESLLAAAEQGNLEDFRSQYDARLVRDFRGWFSGHAEEMAKCIQTGIRPREANGLGPSQAYKPIVPERSNRLQFLARWQWPQPRFSSECLLAVCREKAKAEDSPKDVEIWKQWKIDRKTWVRNDSCLVFQVRQDWLAGFAVVWAILDLGWAVHYSEPLVLGRLGDLQASGLPVRVCRIIGRFLAKKAASGQEQPFELDGKGAEEVDTP